MTGTARSFSPTELITVVRFGIHTIDILKEHTATQATPPLAVGAEPTPVLACHLACARDAIKRGYLPPSTLTDYRIFSTAGSLTGTRLRMEPRYVVADGHALQDDLVRVLIRMRIIENAVRVEQAIAFINTFASPPYPDSPFGELLTIRQGEVTS